MYPERRKNMYTDKSAGKGIGLKQIVSIAVIAVCILTMLLPWVYVGMKSTDGDNWDMNSLGRLDLT